LSDTPLTEAVRLYRERTRARLHVPAHGGGRGDAALEALWPDLLSWDVTEQPELDDLSHPDGPLAQGQALAADLFHAAEAFFLTGGATLGVEAAVFAALSQGGALLAARDAHRCLLGAALATNADVVLVEPRRDPGTGASLGPSEQDLADAIARHPDVRAALITYPSYLGIAPDLGRLARRCRDQGVALIADAAHGAHFGRHPELPPAALDCGADYAVLGLHKTGGSLTQSAILLVAEGAVGRDAVRLALDVLATSSPSYLLLLSIEQALHDMRSRGPELVDGALRAAEGVRGPARIRVDAAQDPLRIALRSPDVEDLWRTLALHGVRGEYLDGDTALYCVPFGAREQEVAPLRRAVAGLRAAPPPERVRAAGPVRLNPSAAIRAKRSAVRLADAVGRVASNVVAPVPPGIPALWPGERISQSAVEGLQAALAQGRRLMGIDHELVWVVAE